MAKPRLPSPSSKAFEVVQQHVAFALQYHLVQAYTGTRKNTDWLWTPNPLAEKLGSFGRLSDLPWVDELAIQIQIVRGCRPSTHAALVGNDIALAPFRGFTTEPSLDFIDIGTRRQPIASAAERRLVELLAEFPLAHKEEPLETVVERLVLAYASSVLVTEDPEEALGVMRNLLKQGLRFLSRADPEEPSEQRIQTYLSDIARMEMTFSILLNRSTSLSFHTAQLLFPRTMHPLQPFSHLSRQSIDLVTSCDPSTKPIFESFVEESFIPPLVTQLDVSLGLLARGSSISFNSLQKAVPLIVSLQASIQKSISAVEREFPLAGAGAERARRFVSHIFSFELVLLEIAFLSHTMAWRSYQGDGDEHLLRQTEAVVFSGLELLAARLRFLLAYPLAPLNDMGEMIKVASTLRMFGGSCLRNWCAQSRESANVILTGLLFASWGSHLAGDLAHDILDALNMTSEPSSRFVLSSESIPSPSPSMWSVADSVAPDSDACDLVSSVIETLSKL
ncbi:hypothetical protein T439DRAFT_381274, partial [Meredithblackwellia eburnea MCA 4105]